MQLGNFLAVLGHDEVTAGGRVVRAAHFFCAVEGECVTGNRHVFARHHAHVTFGRITLHERNAHDEHGHAKVRQVHAPERTRVASELLEKAHLHIAAAFADVVNSTHGNPGGKRDAHEDPGAPAAHQKRHGNADGNSHHKDDPQTLGKLRKVCLLPAGKRCHAEQEEHRQHQRTEHSVKVRGTNGDLAGIERIQKERIKRTEKNCTHRHNEQHVVDKQQRFAAHHREIAAQPHGRCAPGKEQKRQTDHDDQEGQNEDAAFRVGRKGVHGSENARTNEERAQ